MKQMLEEAVDLRYLIFIDGSSSSLPTSANKDKKDLFRALQEVRASKNQKSNPKQTKECLYLANIKSLTDFIVAVDQAVGALQALENPGVTKFLVFDSPSTLLLYNDAASVFRFLHNITKRLRESKVRGIFLVLEQESDKNSVDQLCLFSDKIINIK
jgi:KaiC/GvpD/RAD55 family RecA-like ATPase